MDDIPSKDRSYADDADRASSEPNRVRMRSFAHSLPMSLLRSREAVMRQFRPGLRHFGMTEQQWRVLRALTAVSEIDIMALADMTFLLAPSLTRILQDLDERGLIARRVPEEDLRRVMVSISGRGTSLIERAAPPLEAIYSEITRRYGTERLRLLQEMLGDLEQVLDEPLEAPLVLTRSPGEDPPHRRGRPPQKIQRADRSRIVAKK